MLCCHGPHVLLVGREDRPHVVRRATGDGVPVAAGLGGVAESAFGDHLAHRIALALGRAMGVVLVRVAILVEGGAADVLLHVRLGHHRGDAGGDDDAAHGAGLVHARDEVVAHAPHVLVVAVVADVGDMANAVATGEDGVEIAGVVQIRRMQGEAPGREAGHRLQEIHTRRVICVAHTGPHPVALVQKAVNHPAADEAGRPGHRHGA